MDVAVARRFDGEAEVGLGGRLRRDGAAGAQKNEIKPWLKDEWVIPPEQSAEFVWHMEDVLHVHHRPHDPKRPAVGLDEKPVQLVADVREPLPAEPGGVPRRQDHEYGRNGTANVFCASEPSATGGGWR